ncbi:MAG TPA: hypothetical protein ENN21_09265, partial [Spirochaetes bacterium]|nr:hypothetical protein [Spirochaetota bacterium]
GKGRVMLAAAQRESVREYLEALQSLGLVPSRLGLESHALYECYKYFNTVNDETVIQLDMGHTKTILNIISGNHLLYSRSIPLGTGEICRFIAEHLKISLEDARGLFLRLDLDLGSLENNYRKEVYKTLNLNRAKLKKIYDAAFGLVEEISAQVLLSLKSFSVDYGEIEISRMLISGGGSSIQGAGAVFSRDLEIPVISLPFLENYSERQIRTQFPIVFGTLLSYMGGSGGVNFLRGEFVPDLVRRTRKVYYLSAFFSVLSLIVLVAYIAGSSLIKYRNSASYKKILNDRLKQYFLVRDPVKDPVATAAKMVNEEKKELTNLDNILDTGEGVLETMKTMLTHFPGDEGFILRNMVINENVIRIDGVLSSSAKIDEFKNKLIESKQFESVDLNTTLSKRNEVNFTMVLKKKQSAPRGETGK